MSGKTRKAAKKSARSTKAAVGKRAAKTTKQRTVARKSAKTVAAKKKQNTKNFLIISKFNEKGNNLGFRCKKNH